MAKSKRDKFYFEHVSDMMGFGSVPFNGHSLMREVFSVIVAFVNVYPTL